MIQIILVIFIVLIIILYKAKFQSRPKYCKAKNHIDIEKI